MTTLAIEGGFADPVFGAQSTFRALMDAMAQPGEHGKVAHPISPPAPLASAAGAIACTLADADTPLWLDTPLAESGSVIEWLGFNTGAPLVGSPSFSVLALVSDSGRMPPLRAFNHGTQEYPDRSTTIILQLDALEGGDALRLNGPGIRGSRTIAPPGLPVDFASAWDENRNLFPRGVDLILTAGDRFICLPRSVRIATVED